MKLYHYSTWNGAAIHSMKLVQPNRKYCNWVVNSLTINWPNLVFLTHNDEWEPSIQAVSENGFWEKCGSYPETNAALGIPCWKFKVSVNGMPLTHPANLDAYPSWNTMLEEARVMGSNIDDWVVTVQPVEVIESYKFIGDSWICVD